VIGVSGENGDGAVKLFDKNDAGEAAKQADVAFQQSAIGPFLRRPMAAIVKRINSAA